ncbi:MAG: oligosaccharide flippase family protein [Chitinophagaceae bacterium]|nr:oligosaccharide flippase family protein [Chitinophagaceae bacterium]
MKPLSQHFTWQLLATLVSLLAPLITFPYVSRILGPDLLGRVHLFDYAANLVVVLASFGIPLFGAREVARYRDNPAYCRRLVACLAGFHLLISAFMVIFCVVFFMNHPHYKNESALLLLGCLYVLFHTLACDWYLEGTEQFRYISVRNVVLRVAGIAAVFILIRHSEDYNLYYATTVASMFLVFLANWIRIKPDLLYFRSGPHIAEVRQMSFFFFTSVLVSIYDYLDTLLLGWLSHDTELGYYAAALRLVRMALLIMLNLNIILFPRLSFLHQQQNYEQINHLMRHAVSFILLLGVPAMAVYVSLAPQIISVFSGKQFEPAITAMQILSPLPLLISLSNLWRLFYFSNPNKKALPVILIASCGLVLHILLNLLLIPPFGHRGAAVASVGAETFVMLLFGLVIKIRFPWKTLFQSLLSALPFLLLARLIFESRVRPGDLLSGIGILVTGSAIYIIFILMIFRNETALMLKDKIFAAIGKKTTS